MGVPKIGSIGVATTIASVDGLPTDLVVVTTATPGVTMWVVRGAAD